MKKIPELAFISILIVLLYSSAYADQKVELDTLVKGNTTFAVDLYRKVSSTDGNIFFSPYSISTVLAMTYGGARGDTEEQMAKTMKFTLKQNRLHPAFAKLQKRINLVQRKTKVKLLVANSLWPRFGYTLLDEYLYLTKTFYQYLITPLDYQSSPETARRTINQWVEDKTQEKIKELLKPSHVTVLTELILVNAIYFKGDWEKAFKESETKEAPFYLSDNQTGKTSFMKQKGDFRYGENNDLQILELPYQGRDLSMFVILPKERGKLVQIENKLSPENLNRWTKFVTSTEVTVFLPRYRIASSFSLNKTLKSLGMVDAFNSAKADFSGITGGRNLFISQVIHKAFVDVNEKGTEAAAATAVIALRGMMKQTQPVVFKADHPFLFLIRENRSGSLLFFGRVNDPSATER